MEIMLLVVSKGSQKKIPSGDCSVQFLFGYSEPNNMLVASPFYLGTGEAVKTNHIFLCYKNIILLLIDTMNDK